MVAANPFLQIIDQVKALAYIAFAWIYKSWPPSDAYIVGGAAVFLFLVSKYGEINQVDPVTKGYLEPAFDPKARDFLGPVSFAIGLALYIFLGLLLYFSVCHISPVVLSGSLKLFTDNPRAGEGFKDVQYPLYVAALFLGVTQPAVSKSIGLGSKLRDFCQLQLGAPSRVVEMSERLARDALDRADGTKKNLIQECRRLLDSDLRSRLEGFADLSLLAYRLEKIGLKDEAQIDEMLKDISTREAEKMIQRIITLILMAGVRKSGKSGLERAANAISGSNIIAPKKPAVLVPRFSLFSFLFMIEVFICAVILTLIKSPMVAHFSANPRSPLWPTNLGFVFNELLFIVLPIFLCSIILFYFMSIRIPAYKQLDDETLPIKRISQIIQEDFKIFLNCFLFSLFIIAMATAYNVGFCGVPAGQSQNIGVKIALLPLKSCHAAIMVFFTVVVLERHIKFRSYSILAWAFALVLAEAGIAMISDVCFLQLDRFSSGFYADQSPGYDHILFAVCANTIISLCAFVTTVLIFEVTDLRSFFGSSTQSTAAAVT